MQTEQSRTGSRRNGPGVLFAKWAFVHLPYALQWNRPIELTPTCLERQRRNWRESGEAKRSKSGTRERGLDSWPHIPCIQVTSSPIPSTVPQIAFSGLRSSLPHSWHLLIGYGFLFRSVGTARPLTRYPSVSQGGSLRIQSRIP